MDEVERTYQGRLVVIRLNIHESFARPLLGEFGFQYTPTFIFFDATGEEIWRSVGSLDQDVLSELMITR